MNYSYQEAEKELEALISSLGGLTQERMYTIKCLWEIILKGSEDSQDKSDEAYTQGYADGKKVTDSSQYDEGYSEAESTFGGKE